MKMNGVKNRKRINLKINKWSRVNCRVTEHPHKK